ncbi:MAG: hypothetical protein A3G27_12560 [Betaproteobacteria bacterium RIFCSPLOWO2_12_FULL_66_14]|nr:MAG: hypothetical protein A3G27_12560 [Betaproteobacteria bacterium RIFCSPLOWO2_12_FULL_66_14]
MPARSVAELLELAKAKPGSVSWGSWGTSSSSNFYIEWLKNAANIVFMNVPYKSATQAVQAAVSGEIQVAIYAVGLGMPMVKAGKLRALAVTSAQRSVFAPELPSFKESSIDVSIQAWWGWFAPAATPKEIVQRLNGDIARLYADTAFREKYGPGLGFELIGPALRSPEEFAAYLVTERAMYARLVKLAGVKPQ